MSGTKLAKRGLYLAACTAAIGMLTSARMVQADVLLSNFEPPLPGAGMNGWFNYNGNVTALSQLQNPTGGTSFWMDMEYNNAGGNWVTAGPTIQPWANSNFNDANFQANNYLQFDIIFPSSSWLSNDAALPIGLQSNGGGAGLLQTVNTTQKDVAQHVAINYSTYKTSGGGTGNITDWMNLLLGFPDIAQWGATPFDPHVFVDNIYLTPTAAVPIFPPAPNNGTWDSTKSGDWATASNWVGGVAANGSANTATFGPSTTARSVNQNTAITLGGVYLDSANGYTITGNAITLGGAAPSVIVNSGSHSIAALSISAAATFNVAASSALTIPNFTTGGFQQVNKTGAGSMTVNQINFVSLAADGTFTITNGPDNGFIFAISTLSPTAYIDLGSNTWRTNNIFGGGTIKTNGKLSTGLFGDGTFDGVLTGSGSLNIGSLTEGDADHTTVLTGNNTFTGGVTLYRGTLIAKNLRNGQLTIGDPAAAGGSVSKVQISAKTAANDPTGTSVVPSLTINGAAQLDMTNNSMVIDYTGPVGSLVGDTRTQLSTGKITSSSADASHKLGYGDNGVLHKTTFGGQNVDASSLLIKYTFAGDANLDGQVDVTDLGALATAWQTSGPWTSGDFDYSGFVDVTDLGSLATNWQAGVGSPLGRTSLTDALVAVGLGGVSVPEPASIGLIAVGAWSLAGSRRRRN